MDELLRQFTCALDAAERGDEQADPQVEVAVDTQQESPPEAMEPAGVMIPPLQAKLEMLKKETGLESVYDGQGEEREPDALKTLLDILRINAGLGPVGKSEVSTDEDEGE